MIPDYKCKKQDEDPDYNQDYSTSQSSYESSYYDYGQPESWSSSGKSYQKHQIYFTLKIQETL